MKEFYKEFKDASKAFEEKYKEVIYKIADYNGVDVGVGCDMFKTNLEFDATIYSGGGAVPSEVWQEMLHDYRELKAVATTLAGIVKAEQGI